MSKIIALKKLIDNHFEKLDELINDNDKTFYIYTTGIASWAENDLINIWKNCRYDNIIKQIPDQFKNIVIKHYDPIIFMDTPQNSDDPLTQEQKLELEKQQTNTISIIQKINQILLEQDTKSLNNNKKTKQTFIKDFFDFSSLKETKKHYIIFDFAHLFYYYYNLSDNKYFITFKNSYDNIKSKEFYNNEILNLDLNCIYIPYPTNCTSFWEIIKYFNYDHTTQKITSYIEFFFRQMSTILSKKSLDDAFINKELKSNNILEYNHKDQFENILENILYKNRLIKYVGQHKNDIKTKMYYYIDNNNIKNELFIEFFNKLFLNTNETELFNIDNYKIIEDFKKKNLDKI